MRQCITLADLTNRRAAPVNLALVGGGSPKGIPALDFFRANTQVAGVPSAANSETGRATWWQLSFPAADLAAAAASFSVLGLADHGGGGELIALATKQFRKPGEHTLSWSDHAAHLSPGEQTRCLRRGAPPLRRHGDAAQLCAAGQQRTCGAEFLRARRAPIQQKD